MRASCILTSSVVVAGLQTSTSSKVGRGRDTLSPYMYRASADFSTFSGNEGKILPLIWNVLSLPIATPEQVINQLWAAVNIYICFL